jgi:hypothetical protein
VTEEKGGGKRDGLFQTPCLTRFSLRHRPKHFNAPPAIDRIGPLSLNAEAHLLTGALHPAHEQKIPAGAHFQLTRYSIMRSDSYFREMLPATAR